MPIVDGECLAIAANNKTTRAKGRIQLRIDVVLRQGMDPTKCSLHTGFNLQSFLGSEVEISLISTSAHDLNCCKLRTRHDTKVMEAQYLNILYALHSQY